MKLYKHIIITAALLLAFCAAACTSKTSVNSSEVAPCESETVATDSVSDGIAELIAEIYGKLSEPGLEYKYCSKGYLALYDAIAATDTVPDEVGFFNYNHWTSAQDGPDNPVFAIKQITLESDSVIIAEVREDEMNTGANLRLIKENGAWRVDDFFIPGDSIGEVERMRDYLHV